MPKRISFYEFIIYLIGFVVGFAPVLFTALIALASMMPAGGMGRSINTEYYIMLFLLSPIVGLACFQAIFSLSTGHWRSWKFWLIAPVFVYGTMATAWRYEDSLRVDVFTFIAIIVGFLFFTGLILLQWTKVANIFHRPR